MNVESVAHYVDSTGTKAWRAALAPKPGPAVHSALAALSFMLTAIPFRTIALVETEWSNLVAAFVFADVV